MEAVLATWGNSTALRIPKKVMELLGLTKGSRVKMEVKNNKLMIQVKQISSFERMKQMASELDINEMCSRITPENMHELYDDGPVGKEIW